MKNVQIVGSVLAIAAVCLMSFKSDTTTSYGGTGSARISVYDKKFSGTTYVRGEKVSSSTINVTESCSNYNRARAEDAIKRRIEQEAGYKTKALQEWDYDSDITYRISTCD